MPDAAGSDFVGGKVPAVAEVQAESSLICRVNDIDANGTFRASEIGKSNLNADEALPKLELFVSDAPGVQGTGSPGSGSSDGACLGKASQSGKDEKPPSGEQSDSKNGANLSNAPNQRAENPQPYDPKSDQESAKHEDLKPKDINNTPKKNSGFPYPLK